MLAFEYVNELIIEVVKMLWVLYAFIIMCGVGGLILNNRKNLNATLIEEHSVFSSNEYADVFGCVEDDFPSVNPTTGAPMVYGSMIDVTGKAYGQM